MQNLEELSNRVVVVYCYYFTGSSLPINLKYSEHLMVKLSFLLYQLHLNNRPHYIQDQIYSLKKAPCGE